MVLSRAAALVCRGNKTEKEVAKFFETFIHSQMKPKELHTPRPGWKLTKIHNYKHFNFSSLEQYFCTSWYSDRAVKSLSTSWQQTQTDLHLGSKEMLLNTVMCCLQVKHRSCQPYTKKASPLFLHTVLKSSASSFPRSKHIKLKLLFLLPPHTKRYELDAVTNLSMKRLKNIFSHTVTETYQRWCIQHYPQSWRRCPEVPVVVPCGWTTPGVLAGTCACLLWIPAGKHER